MGTIMFTGLILVTAAKLGPLERTFSWVCELFLGHMDMPRWSRVYFLTVHLSRLVEFSRLSFSLLFFFLVFVFLFFFLFFFGTLAVLTDHTLTLPSHKHYSSKFTVNSSGIREASAWLHPWPSMTFLGAHGQKLSARCAASLALCVFTGALILSLPGTISDL